MWKVAEVELTEWEEAGKRLARDNAGLRGEVFFFSFTTLGLSHATVYEPWTRARLGATAYFCKVVVRAGREPTTLNPESPALIIHPTPQSRNMQHEIRNSEYETRNPKYETRNPKYETRNTKYGIRNTKHGTRSTKCGTRNTKYGTRNTKYEMLNPKSGIRNTKHEIRTAEHEIWDTEYERGNAGKR